MDYDAYDALLHYVFKQTQGDAWFKPSGDNVAVGVCLRVNPGEFRVFPYENHYLVPFESAVRLLNPVVAVKMRSAAVHSALATMADDAVAIYIDVNTRIQVLDTMNLLPRADKEQCGAFIRDERVLVVWADDIDQIIPIANELEAKLIKLVWTSRRMTGTIASFAGTIPSSPSSGSFAILTENVRNSARVPDTDVIIPDRDKPKPPTRSFGWSWRLSPSKREIDPEKASSSNSRPIKLMAPFYGGLGMALSIFFIGNGVNVLIQESLLDGDYIRFAYLSTAPFLLCVSLFFTLQFITNISMIIGPVAQYHENSRYYSAKRPAPNQEVDASLPHITIELPVFKESLEQVIAPSVISLKKAMQTYARQGGTSTIFVHDDGLQVISEEQRDARIAFYANHNIGWVARPPHGVDGYVRAGRFKKASNMNYGLTLSLKLEKHLLALEAAGEEDGEPEGGLSFEDRAMEMAIEEIYQESGKKWRPLACNGKALRIGEIILLVDSDTVVPEDCLRDAARELAECPDVAIIQHESDVMQVVHHYFENGIAHFTRRINKCISMGCANGEIAPFVGHNAFLRWSAIQEAAFVDPIDGKMKIWSESNVSEDFDMALRLQLKGYIIRWASYSELGFKEGVSLTVDDELSRWQKYAYGCNELIFNPLKDWWRKGPINKQLRTFLWSAAPVHYKISMCSYMFSYYGIAASAALAVINYITLGVAMEVDGFYIHSFEIWLACAFVFPVLGNVGFTLLEYRLGHRGIISSFIENITWIPFFFFFFGGLSIHLSGALLAHLFSFNINWSATKKEVERSNFFIEVPRILKRFWVAFLLCFVTIAGMAIFATPLVPLGWRIETYGWSVLFPLFIVAGCHILFPIILNPYLMVFSY